MPENMGHRFLAALEGGSRTTGYMPAGGVSKSGVTIATGFDLGQRNESDLHALRLAPALIAKLRPYLGARGPQAQALLAKAPLLITSSEAQAIDEWPTAEAARASSGEALLSKLDLRTFPSSQNMLSDDQAHTLTALYPERALSGATTAKIDTEDWSLTLEVVAAARLNDNEADDWIVWLTDEAKSGNYRNYRTLVICDPADQQNSLTTVAYPK